MCSLFFKILNVTSPMKTLKIVQLFDSSKPTCMILKQNYTNYKHPKPNTCTSLKTCKSINFHSCCKGIWNSVQVQSKFDKFSGL